MSQTRFMHTCSRAVGLAFLAFVLALAVSAPATAGSVRSGGVTIYYNALSGAALPASSAKTYGLRHTREQGLVIITASDDEGAHAINVPIEVSGQATTLLGRTVKLTFRHIHENGNLSTLATFDVHGPETMNFDFVVTPRGGVATRIRFAHSYQP